MQSWATAFSGSGRMDNLLKDHSQPLGPFLSGRTGLQYIEAGRKRTGGFDAGEKTKGTLLLQKHPWVRDG
jgi:hypothetical protein